MGRSDEPSPSPPLLTPWGPPVCTPSGWDVVWRPLLPSFMRMTALFSTPVELPPYFPLSANAPRGYLPMLPM